MERQNGSFLGRCVAQALMACGVLMAAQATPVVAQALPKNYPVKSIRMVVPFAAGAPPGLATRLYSESMRVLADTEIKKRFDDVGIEAVGMPTGAFVRYVEKDAAEMRELAHKIGLARKN